MTPAIGLARHSAELLRGSNRIQLIIAGAGTRQQELISLGLLGSSGLASWVRGYDLYYSPWLGQVLLYVLNSHSVPGQAAPAISCLHCLPLLPHTSVTLVHTIAGAACMQRD